MLSPSKMFNLKCAILVFLIVIFIAMSILLFLARPQKPIQNPKPGKMTHDLAYKLMKGTNNV